MNCDVIMARALLKAHVQMSFLNPVKLHFGNKLTNKLRTGSSSRTVEKQQNPDLVRVLKASHVMYVGCDVGGRKVIKYIKYMPCQWRLEVDKTPPFMIALHLASGPSKCKDDSLRVVNDGI